MPENRFLRIVVLLLLLLNAGTLGFLVLQRSPDNGRPERDRPQEGGGPARFLRRELALTDEQEQAYRRLRDDHHGQVEDIRGQMRRQEQQLYALMKSSDTAGISRAGAVLIDSIGAGQRRIVAITFEHFREVRALCTPKQQQKFDEVILEALSQLR